MIALHPAEGPYAGVNYSTICDECGHVLGQHLWLASPTRCVSTGCPCVGFTATTSLERGPSTHYPGETRLKCPTCGKFELRGVVCSGCLARICPQCHSQMDSKGSVEPSDSEGRGGTDLYQCPKCRNVEIV